MSEHTPEGFGPGEEIVPQDAEEFTPAAEDDGQARDDDPGPVSEVHAGPAIEVGTERGDDPFPGAQEAELIEASEGLGEGELGDGYDLPEHVEPQA